VSGTQSCSKRKVIGQKLRVTPKYYDKAVETVLEFGCKLVQVIWRKLKPDEITLAERRLNDISYKLIVRRQYKLASRILEFGLVEMKKHGIDSTRKMMVVNYANTEKLSGNMTQAIKILDAEDWSACTDNYHICVSAVKNDIDEVIKLMKRVVDMKLVKKEDFRDWPVFISAREDARFAAEFEVIFGERLLQGKEVPSDTSIDKGSDIESGEGSVDIGRSDDGASLDPTIH
jgi:hypothetical protein